MTRVKSRGFDARIGIVLTLGVAALTLWLVELALPESPAEHAVEVRDEVAEISAILDTLFSRYGIDSKAVRTWHVQTPDKKFIRVEQRVFVPSEFISLRFNHDLGKEVERFGARAVATERTKENTVTMHVKKDRTIIQSIMFVVRRNP